MTEQTDREKVAAHLASIHFDGTGCGTTGTNACSNCYGPSPMDAYEVADAVLAVLDVPALRERVADYEHRITCKVCRRRGRA